MNEGLVFIFGFINGVCFVLFILRMAYLKNRKNTTKKERNSKMKWRHDDGTCKDCYLEKHNGKHKHAEQLEAYRRELRLIREHGRKGAGYLCACIADRVLEDGS